MDNSENLKLLELALKNDILDSSDMEKIKESMKDVYKRQGPQCLCLGGWLISCLLDHPADDFLFFTADISIIQISGYRSSGNSGKPGYFINVHNLCTSSFVLLYLSLYAYL